MANDFLDVALTPFRFLTEAGHYRLTYQHVSSASDIGTLLFESPILHILFGRQHGRFFLDIASASHSSDPDDWYDFYLVRRLLDCAPDDPFEDSPCSFAASLPFASADSAATELRQYLSRIEGAFAPENFHNTKSLLDRNQQSP